MPMPEWFTSPHAQSALSTLSAYPTLALAVTFLILDNPPTFAGEN